MTCPYALRVPWPCRPAVRSPVRYRPFRERRGFFVLRVLRLSRPPSGSAQDHVGFRIRSTISRLLCQGSLMSTTVILVAVTPFASRSPATPTQSPGFRSQAESVVST